MNKLDNAALTDLPTGDIQVGTWDYTAQQLKPWVNWTDPAVAAGFYGKYVGPGISLPVQKTSSHNGGAVTMFLATIFKINTMDVKTQATAALSGVGSFPPGYGTFPIAVNSAGVTKAGGVIIFGPTGVNNAAWSSLDDSGSASANTMKGLINRSDPSPGLKMGDIINLNNGDVCSAVKAAIDHYVPKSYNPPYKGVYDLTAINAPNPPPLVVFPTVDEGTGPMNGSTPVTGGMMAYITLLYDTNAKPPAAGTTYTPYGGTPQPYPSGKCLIGIEIVNGVAPGTGGGGKYWGTFSLQPLIVSNPTN